MFTILFKSAIRFFLALLFGHFIAKHIKERKILSSKSQENQFFDRIDQLKHTILTIEQSYSSRDYKTVICLCQSYLKNNLIHLETQRSIEQAHMTFSHYDSSVDHSIIKDNISGLLFYYMGMSNSHLNKVKPAIQQLEKALLFDLPQAPLVYKELASLYESKGNHSKSNYYDDLMTSGN